MIDELATFSAVVKHGSMTRAAHEMHLSQPAVSQRLRALEETYGMPLLKRTNRGVELTKAGEILNRYAQRLLSLDRSLQEEMNALRAAEPRQITVGATSAIGGYALPCTVYLFQQKHPSARIQLVIGKRQEVLQKLEDGLLDLALVEGLGEEHLTGDWQTVVVSEEELVLIGPVEGPLAERTAYSLDDLIKVPLIVREPGAGSRLVLEETWKALGRKWSELNVAMELTSTDAIKTSVASGHGVSLVSKWCVRVDARIGSLRMIPLEGVSFTSRWTLVYPKHGMRGAMDRALLRTLRSPAERGFC